MTNFEINFHPVTMPVAISNQMPVNQIKNLDAARDYAAQFAAKNQLSPCSSVQLQEDGTLVMRWRCDNIACFEDKKIEALQNELSHSFLTDLKVIISPNRPSSAIIDWYCPYVGDDNHSLHGYFLPELGLQP